jgi:hypothetical protein
MFIFYPPQEEIPDSVVEEEAFKARLAAVKATPETNGPELGENFQYQQVENQNYGPAVGVYPPPASVASASHRDQVKPILNGSKNANFSQFLRSQK